MAKVKLDTTKFKDFLFKKGERVGLVIAVVIMAGLLALGAMAALGSGKAPTGKPWAESLKEQAKKLEGQLVSLPPPVPPEIDKLIPQVDVTKVEPTFSQVPWSQYADPANNKRVNPPVLTILNGPKDHQIDVLRTGILTYRANKDARKVEGVKPAGGEKRPLVYLRPTRMAVVVAAFPFKEQLELVRQALRLEQVSDVLGNAEYAPRFTGLVVKRYELTPKGPENPVDLFRYDAKADKTEVPEPLDEVFRQAVFEGEFTAKYGTYFKKGLATPLPQLAYGNYPKLKIEGVKAEEGNVAAAKDGAKDGAKEMSKMFMPKLPGGKGSMPGLPGVTGPKGPMGPMGEEGGQEAAEPAGTPTDIAFKELTDTTLVERFRGKYEVFDPLGQGAGDTTQGTPTPGMMPKGKMPFQMPPGFKGPAMPPGGNAPGQGAEGADSAALDPETDRLLVRFFDIDLEPGKTYAWLVQVRMANPNHGKKTEVAHQKLADQKELVSPPQWTMPVTITPEYFYYAVDQRSLESKVPRGGNDGVVGGTRVMDPKPDETPVQIHLWMERAEDPDRGMKFTLADWVIGERLFTRRGEFIGRPRFMAEVLVWNEYKGEQGAFEIGSVSPAGKGVARKAGATGVPVNLQVGSPPPLLVDFDGGKRPQTAGRPEDVSAAELLILTPEGRLEVRDSRTDTDPATRVGRERTARLRHWADRLKEVRSNRAQANPNRMPPGQPGAGAAP